MEVVLKEDKKAGDTIPILLNSHQLPHTPDKVMMQKLRQRLSATEEKLKEMQKEKGVEEELRWQVNKTEAELKEMQKEKGVQEELRRQTEAELKERDEERGLQEVRHLRCKLSEKEEELARLKEKQKEKSLQKSELQRLNEEKVKERESLKEVKRLRCKEVEELEMLKKEKEKERDSLEEHLRQLRCKVRDTEEELRMLMKEKEKKLQKPRVTRPPGPGTSTGQQISQHTPPMFSDTDKTRDGDEGDTYSEGRVHVWSRTDLLKAMAELGKELQLGEMNEILTAEINKTPVDEGMSNVEEIGDGRDNNEEPNKSKTKVKSGQGEEGKQRPDREEKRKALERLQEDRDRQLDSEDSDQGTKV